MTIGPARYEPTANDRLWMLRAVEGEGRPERVVAQALVNRFMFLRATGRGHLYPTLADFVQEYADPVDPKWATGGRKYEAKMRSLTGEVERKRLVAAGRRRGRMRALTEFEPHVVEAVNRAFTQGPVDLPHRSATDYQAPFRATPSHLVRVTDHERGENTFYRVRADWDGYTVIAAPRMAQAGALGALVLVSYLVWESSK